MNAKAVPQDCWWNCRINVSNDLMRHVNLKREGWVVVEDKEWNPIKVNWKDLIFTKIDWINFKWLTDNQIIDLVKYHTWIDIKTKEWIKAFNFAFSTAKWVYLDTRSSLILEKRWSINLDNFNDQDTNTTEWILNFLKLSNKWDWKWIIWCYITKLSYAVHDILTTFWYIDLIEVEERLFSKLQWPLSIVQASWDEWEYIWNIWWKRFVLHWRPKSLRSMAEKLTNNPDYTTADEIHDWIAYTFEINWNDTDKLLLMQHVVNVIQSLWWNVSEVDNKWVALFDERNIWKFDSEFIDFINKNLDVDVKWWTSEWYREIKIKWEINWVKIEIKFTEKWNENQDWINLQSVYEYISKHIEWWIVRNWWLWYITSEEIWVLVVDFFDRLDFNLAKNPEKRWTKRSDYLKELWDDLQNKLTDKDWNPFISKRLKYENQSKSESKLVSHLIWWLIKYYENKLVEVKLKNWEEVFTSERWYWLSTAWIYPEMERRLENKKVIKDRRKKS